MQHICFAKGTDEKNKSKLMDFYREMKINKHWKPVEYNQMLFIILGRCKNCTRIEQERKKNERNIVTPLRVHVRIIIKQTIFSVCNNSQFREKRREKKTVERGIWFTSIVIIFTLICSPIYVIGIVRTLNAFKCNSKFEEKYFSCYNVTSDH